MEDNFKAFNLSRELEGKRGINKDREVCVEHILVEDKELSFCYIRFAYCKSRWRGQVQNCQVCSLGERYGLKS